MPLADLIQNKEGVELKMALNEYVRDAYEKAVFGNEIMEMLTPMVRLLATTSAETYHAFRQIIAVHLAKSLEGYSAERQAEIVEASIDAFKDNLCILLNKVVANIDSKQLLTCFLTAFEIEMTPAGVQLKPSAIPNPLAEPTL
jgi:hypothetical protein